MDPNRTHHDVLIVGAGLVGMTLALALARQGTQVAVIDPQDTSQLLQKGSDGRASAIAHGSHLFFKDIGLWEGLALYAGPIKEIRVSDHQSSFFLHYHHNLVGKGPMGYMIENAVLRQALFSLASTYPSLQLFAGVRARQFSSDAYRAHLLLEDGRSLSAPLCIGADGKSSWLRQAAGITTVNWPYHQHGIVCNVRHEKPHRGIAQERFLPSGPFAILPLKDPHVSSLVWTEPSAQAPLYMKMADDLFIEAICGRFDGYLGGLSLASPRFTYPLSLSHAKSYIGTRLALAGDAAHAIHPLAGQGFNLGIRDSISLASLIQHYNSLGLDIGSDSLLEEYSASRKFDTLSLVAITDGLNHLFQQKNSLIKAARRLGMATVNHLSPLKKMLMKHAMGM